MLNLRSFLKQSVLLRENFLFGASRAMSKNKKGKRGAKGVQSTSSSKSEVSAQFFSQVALVY